MLEQTNAMRGRVRREGVPSGSWPGPVSSTGDSAITKADHLLLAWSPHSPGGWDQGHLAPVLADRIQQWGEGAVRAGWNQPCEGRGTQHEGEPRQGGSCMLQHSEEADVSRAS